MKHTMLPARLYASPISLPEGRSGRFAIAHDHFLPENGPVAVLSMREALLTGRRAVGLRLEAPLKVHRLLEYREDGLSEKIEATWMSDEPQELRQAAEWIRASEPFGRVLVGGLGLGIVATWLNQMRTGALEGFSEGGLVESVTVVEKEPDVISLVAPYQKGYDVVCSDLSDYLRALPPPWPFDFAFFDIWQGTSESTWWTTVLPLRRLVGLRFGAQRLGCWAEEIMLGQVRRAFHIGNASFAERIGEATGRHWYYSGFPKEMAEEDVEDFLSTIGLPSWEERWAPCLRFPPWR